MLRTTLRQLVSISGRTILAIGLTSATVLALAPSAKADNISVNNEPITTIVFVPITTLKGTDVDAASTGITIGTITAHNNSNTTWAVRATSGNLGYLKINTLDLDTLGVSYTVTVDKASYGATGEAKSDVALTATRQDLYTTNSTTSEVSEVKFDLKITTNQTLGSQFKNRKSGTYADVITFSYQAP